MKDGGRLVHGVASTYTVDRCRCAECRSAYAVMARESFRRRAARETPEHVHGTANGYGNYSCRCDRCRSAWALASKHFYHKRKERAAREDQ